MDQSSDVDISSHSGDSAGEGDSAVVSEGQVSEPAEPVADSAGEGDSAVVSEGQVSEPAEPVADSVVGEGGQYAWSYADLIEAGLVERGISLNGISPSQVWDDRTQDKPVRLVIDSITLNSCIMRGEIRNHSEDLYARNVTVTVGSINGEEIVQWRWPLTLEPGETAPFEVEIDWFPHSREFYEWELEQIFWNLFGNTSIDVSFDLSTYADVKRAFAINHDETPPFKLFYEDPVHRLLVYDERALELQDSIYWPYSSVYSPILRQGVAQIYPEELIKSNDIELMVAEFTPYEAADMYYLPGTMYPEFYKAGEDDVVSDVRVYQAYKRGNRVIDVWELVPHIVVEQLDSSGLLIEREFIPVSEFTNYETFSDRNVYIVFLDTYGNLPNILERNMEGSSWRHDRSDFVGPMETMHLWMGGVSHKDVASTGDAVDMPLNMGEASCYARGGIYGVDGYFWGERRIEEHFTLGYAGTFDRLEFDGNVSDNIYVDRASITVETGVIRGLIHNNVQTHFARDVNVIATHKKTGSVIGIWQWPLSVQPGERAPFEIWHSEPDLDVEHIEFEVSAILSEEVDPTRSFRLENLWGGRVYGEDFIDQYNYRPYDHDYVEIGSGWHLDHRAIRYGGPQSRYFKDEFLELYRDIVQFENIEDVGLFSFKDVYARMAFPNSHPELAKVVKTQYIEELRAFVAILDSNGRVVGINELTPFTPVYGHSNVDKTYVTVDRIPAPNLWSPNAVRLLVTIPYEDEADMEAGYGYQVWIGGASEPVG